MLSSPTRSTWNRVSPLEVLITRACEPSLHEPNFALHLEVAEYINTKKANRFVFNHAITIEIAFLHFQFKPTRGCNADSSPRQPSQSACGSPGACDVRYSCPVLRVPFPPPNFDERVSQRTCPPLSWTSSPFADSGDAAGSWADTWVEGGYLRWI